MQKLATWNVPKTNGSYFNQHKIYNLHFYNIFVYTKNVLIIFIWSV